MTGIFRKQIHIYLSFSVLLGSSRLLEWVLLNPLCIFIFGRCIVHLRIYLLHALRLWKLMQSCFSSWPTKGPLAIWALEIRLKSLPNSKFHLEDDWQICVCSQTARKWYWTLNSCWNSAGQKCPQMVDEGEQNCGLCCWAHYGGMLLLLIANQEFNCKSDRQMQLSFSTVRTGCQWDHGNLNCRGYAVILCLNQMNLLTQKYSFQIQATRQCRCLLVGQFNHCHLPTARLLPLNSWGKGIHCAFEKVLLWWSRWQDSSLHTHLLHKDLCNQYLHFCCSAVGTGGSKE